MTDYISYCRFFKKRLCFCIIVAINIFPGDNMPIMKLYPVCYRI